MTKKVDIIVIAITLLIYVDFTADQDSGKYICNSDESSKMVENALFMILDNDDVGDPAVNQPPSVLPLEIH